MQLLNTAINVRKGIDFTCLNFMQSSLLIRSHPIDIIARDFFK